MNNTQLLSLFKQFWKYIEENKKIVLCTHVQADGDTIGSAIALRELIKLNNQNCSEIKISGEKPPQNLQFLFELKELNLEVEDDFFNNALKIVVDTSTKSRIYDKRVKTHEALKIDHHPHEGQWKFEIGGDHWPATGELIALMTKILNLKVNKLALEAMAVAIITDTEYFKERNITDQTFMMISYLMSLGLDYANLLKKMHLNNEAKQIILSCLKKLKTKNNVGYAIITKNIENYIVRPMVAYLNDFNNNEVLLVVSKEAKNLYRGEIRSKTYFDVSEIAKKYGGGGHKNSSGFKMKAKNLDDLKNKVFEVVNLINSEIKNI